MRTTLDLPDDLFRQLKLRAFTEGKTIKVVLNDIIRQGLAHQNANQNSPGRRIPFSGTIRGETTPLMKKLNNDSIADLLENT